MKQISSEHKHPVVALIKPLPRSRLMPKSYTITYKDHQTAPDLIEKAAALHGIEPELLIKRFITEGLKPYREPMKDISEFDSLEDFFKGNGLKK
jgi:hypothetical protein